MIRWLDTQPTWRIILSSFLLLLLGWQAVVVLGEYPVFIFARTNGRYPSLYHPSCRWYTAHSQSPNPQRSADGVVSGLPHCPTPRLFTGQIPPSRAIGITLPHRLAGYSRHRHRSLAVHLDSVHVLAASAGSCACRLLPHPH